MNQVAGIFSFSQIEKFDTIWEYRLIFFTSSFIGNSTRGESLTIACLQTTLKLSIMKSLTNMLLFAKNPALLQNLYYL